MLDDSRDQDIPGGWSRFLQSESRREGLLVQNMSDRKITDDGSVSKSLLAKVDWLSA